MDSKGCNFAGSDDGFGLYTLNTPALQSVIFPDTIVIDPGFSDSVTDTQRLNSPRLQFCKEITVMLDTGRDLEVWKTKFQLSICQFLTHINFSGSK
jgi:hypothetical protein